MTPEILLDAIGEVKEKYISEAKNKKLSNNKIILIFGSLTAACMLLFIFVLNIPNLSGYEATDIFRDGYYIENISMSEITENYNGKLLAENIVKDKFFEFYSKTETFSENSDDWYSLLFFEQNDEYKLLMHCMFGEEAEDWKVGMVFTDEATKTININGVNVEIARFDLSLEYKHNYYALFQYDGTVYDLRVNSDNENTIITILEDLIK